MIERFQVLVNFVVKKLAQQYYLRQTWYSSQKVTLAKNQGQSLEQAPKTQKFLFLDSPKMLCVIFPKDTLMFLNSSFY